MPLTITSRCWNIRKSTRWWSGLRVPNHYEPTMAALNAGKHVYTEWPLGRTTAEAEEMAALAQSQGVRNMVGLQARGNPAMLYLKDPGGRRLCGRCPFLQRSAYIGRRLQRTSDRTWQRDRELGANTLTITNGHTIDALRFVWATSATFGRWSAPR